VYVYLAGNVALNIVHSVNKLNLILISLSWYVLGLCEVESGQSNIILDVEESRGNGKCDVLII